MRRRAHASDDSGNEINAVRSAGTTSQHTPNDQMRPSKSTVALQRFDAVLTTTWHETTGRRPSTPSALVHTHENEQRTGCERQLTGIAHAVTRSSLRPKGPPSGSPSADRDRTRTAGPLQVLQTRHPRRPVEHQSGRRPGAGRDRRPKNADGDGLDFEQLLDLRDVR